jgi:aminomethyltransferase
MLTNNISGVKDHRVVYSPMCYPDGGVVDDLLVYKYSDREYFVVVNAGNTDKSFDWLRQNLEGETTIENVSSNYAQLALQGPKSGQILQKCTDFPIEEIQFFHFIPDTEICGKKAIVSKTGYTGEEGFEIYMKVEDATVVWDGLMLAGREEGLVPAGLGARDTLRFEAALPLYGQEISEDISPLEAGLEKFVKLGKEDFIGKDALLQQQNQGVKRKLTGFEMLDRGVPRSHYEVHANGKKIGFVTSGSFSPSLNKNLGLALLDVDYQKEGTTIDIIIRNKVLKAKTVKIPFYTKKYKA